jgi:hypothetical protein
MSAAANAAGYLYASGRLSKSVDKRRREEQLAELEQRLIKRHNVTPARARELAEQALEA